MSSNINPNSGRDPNDPPDRLVARSFSLLDCQAGHESKNRKNRLILLTLGGSDGNVDQITLAERDGVRLLYLLGRALPANRRRSPAKRFGSRPGSRRATPNDVVDSQLAVSWDEERVFRLLERAEPHIAAFLHDSIKSLSKGVSRNCHSVVAAQRLRRRIWHVLLTAVDAARRSH